MNKYTALANMTADPVFRNTKNDRRVCNIRVAINESFKDKNGEKIHSVEFISATAWEDLAEFCRDNLKKGTKIYLSGALRTGTWDRKIKTSDGEISVPTETKFIQLSQVIVINQAVATEIHEDNDPEIDPTEFIPQDEDYADGVV